MSRNPPPPPGLTRPCQPPGTGTDAPPQCSIELAAEPPGIQRNQAGPERQRRYLHENEHAQQHYARRTVAGPVHPKACAPATSADREPRLVELVPPSQRAAMSHANRVERRSIQDRRGLSNGLVPRPGSASFAVFVPREMPLSVAETRRPSGSRSGERRLSFSARDDREPRLPVQASGTGHEPDFLGRGTAARIVSSARRTAKT